MKLTKEACGFTLSEGSLSFYFPFSEAPTLENGFYLLTAHGKAPVPDILAGDRLILPVDEGILIDADGSYEEGEYSFDTISGGFCSREGVVDMLAVEREGKYLLIALASGLYASYAAEKKNGLYTLSLTLKQPTCVYYGIFDSLAALAEGYRRIKGRFVTLKEKSERLPTVQALACGAVFWVWQNNYDEVMYADHNTDDDPSVGDALLTVADALKENGVDNALFGLFFEEDSSFAEPLFKRYGYLSTQYDNYNDVLDPAKLSLIPSNRARRCDYTRRRMRDYPDGVQLLPDGSMKKAWALRGFDGEMHAQNTLCPIVAATRIKSEIPEILKKYPYYKGRFIDVYGGCALCECHSDKHPATREEVVCAKKDAFAYLAELGLLAGTEDGAEPLIDSLVYAEGLHSPIYFRNKDSGRKHAHIYSPEREAHVERHMTDPRSRIPLFQLLHHEHMLSLPYWGDSTASSHALLPKKILFACLYGALPLYSFFLKDFEERRADILASYHRITRVNEKTAMLPMTDFSYLTKDRMVQRSVFGNRYEIVANFGQEPFSYQKGEIPSLDFYFGEID